MRVRDRAALAVAMIVLASSMGATPIQTVQVFFGNLHAHSNLSDGFFGTTPEAAYEFARIRGDLDFMSLSEHNHMMDGEETAALVQAASDSSSTSFAGLYGQEYSLYASPQNHTNIHGMPFSLYGSLNRRYRHVFENIIPSYTLMHPETPVVAGFNHPRDPERDYGLETDFASDWESFVEVMDPIVQLIAIANGPADTSHKGDDPDSFTEFMHWDISSSDVEAWFRYLSRGMHLAPKADHDTHSRSYGFRVATRTAVWLRGDLTRDNVLRALQARHTYATEDRNLRIIPSVSAEGLPSGAFLPGDIIEAGGISSLNIVLDITDSNEPDAGYTVDVYIGEEGGGEHPTRNFSMQADRQGNGQVSLSLPLAPESNSYFILHVRQFSDDPENTSDRDDAWLAPVWVRPTDAPQIAGEVFLDHGPEDEHAFTYSERSDVYHYAHCRIVERISLDNLQTAEAPPEGRRLHQGCPW